ncbi:MAG: DNA-binding MarR family transcriptional regulator [Paracoccaceae bacterium]|jgi:DNA-binding MarR family transcriptional regulator
MENAKGQERGYMSENGKTFQNCLKSDIAAAILIEQLVRGTYSSLRSTDIQPLQWSILRYLARTQVELCTVQYVARFLGLTTAPVSRALQTLSKRGMVEAKSNPDDARSNLLFLTNEGRLALDGDPIILIATRLNMLPDDQRATFKRALQTLVITRNEKDL